MFNPAIFKAYDLRGIFNQDFDLDFPRRLGHAFLELRHQDADCKDKKVLTVVVARDMRLSSPEICTQLIKGLQAAGAQVIDAGLISTPAFYYTVSAQKADGGIMVSASHNPKEWNGFKLVRQLSRPISGDSGINWLRDRLMENNEYAFSVESPLEVINMDNAAVAQFEHDIRQININVIKPLRVVADAANSMGAQYLDLLATRLPITLERLNFNLDGSFPSHEADPLKPENLLQLSAAVKDNHADLGIATDGDGDRVFFVDNNGELIAPAIIRGLLAQIFLKEKPGSKICYDVRPGKITVDLITAAGGQPIPTRVGHSLIKEKMLEEGAYFAGESSGHFFLNLEIGCFEMPMIMIGKLLELFSESNQAVSEYLKPLRRYANSGEINRAVKDKEKVFALLREKYNDGRISLLDGVSITYPNYWFNVRGSNTEDKVRLNLEAIDPEIMAVKRDEILQLIEQC